MKGLYSLFIQSYSTLVKGVALTGNEKAIDWVKGRKEIMARLKAFGPEAQSILWIHAASLGEFEMARPLIKKLKNAYPKDKIVVTFFSPSGYNALVDDSDIDLALYLPIDKKKETREFLELLNPKLAIFVKYEFWPNLLDQIILKDIPFFIASATFRRDHLLFKPWGKFIASRVAKAQKIFVQDPVSEELLKNHGYTNGLLSGDGRFDNVQRIASEEISFPEIERFLDGQKAIIMGSSWPEDEDQVYPLIRQFPQYKFIFAPHDISAKHVSQISESIPTRVLTYSELKEHPQPEDFQILILDTIGMLSRVYAYAHLAFVGGGFKQGLHNILEPLAHGVPTAYGPNHEKFWEANAAAENGGGKIIHNTTDLREWISFFREDFEYQKERSRALEFIQKHSGATQKMFDSIHSFLEN
jgi:3-deoxy-D-manno-octulosonic-acid transferase